MNRAHNTYWPVTEPTVHKTQLY